MGAVFLWPNPVLVLWNKLGCCPKGAIPVLGFCCENNCWPEIWFCGTCAGIWAIRAAFAEASKSRLKLKNEVLKICHF